MDAQVAPAPIRAAGLPQEAPAGYTDPGSAQLLLSLINEARRKVGVGDLSLDGALTGAAQAHAQALAEAGVLAHQLPDGASLSTRAEAAGYVGWLALAENAASGVATSEAVLAMWLGHGPHRDNLLSAAYADAGIGHYFSSATGHFWVLDLGSRPVGR